MVAPILLAIVKGDRLAHLRWKVAHPLGDCFVHLLRCTPLQLSQQREPNSTFLKNHEGRFALSTDGGISLPVAAFAAFLDLWRALLNTNTMSNHDAFAPLVPPFSALFSATLQILGQSAFLFEHVLVDRFVADPLAGHLQANPSGDLLGTPALLQLLVEVVTDLTIGDSLPAPAVAPPTFRALLSPVALVAPIFGAVGLDLTRDHRGVAIQPAGNRADAFVGAQTDHDLFPLIGSRANAYGGG